MRSALIKLVVLQFAAYTALGVLGFTAWTMAFTENLSVLEAIAGDYILGHLARWTNQFPYWGIVILVSAALSLGAVRLLWGLRKKGGYLGVASLSIGFAVNIAFAQNVLVHGLVGFLVGWTLLAPLVAAWKDLK